MMTLVRIESIRVAGEWGNRGPRDIGCEEVTVRDHKQPDGGGCVIVWAEGHPMASIIIERFHYENATTYSSEKDAQRIHLSALGCACSAASHVAKRGSLHHIPKQFGGWGR